jgi:predicted ATPase
MRGEAAVSSRDLVGRDAQLALLGAALADARAGQRRVVLVVGEPGIGKTRLVDGFVDGLPPDARAWVARGQCIEQFGAGEPYLPVLEATSALCAGPDGEVVVDTLRRHAPTWLTQLPAFAELARAGAGGGAGAPERMLREMADALAALASERVVTLVLEDLHWSDPSTIEWLAYLARRRERARLLVVATARQGEPTRGGEALQRVVRELRAQRLCFELGLGEITEDDAARLLAGRLGAVPPPELARALYASAGGNPLFLISVADELARRGLVVDGASGLRLNATVHAIASAVPDDLRALIDKRVDELGDLEQRVLEAGSAVGREFSAAAVAAGIDRTLDEVEACCERLARGRDLLVAAGTEVWPDGTVAGRYAFRHALHQAAL